MEIDSTVCREASPSGAPLLLAFRPPLAWATLLDFIDKHVLVGVEKVWDGGYARTLAVGSRRGWFHVRPGATGQLIVDVADTLLPVLPVVIGKIRALFDLDADSLAIDACLAQDPLLRPSVDHCPGIRVPGCVDPFELAWRTVLGQQVSVAAATRLGSRLIGALGETIATPFEGLDRLTVTPQQFLAASGDTLGQLGWLRSRQKAGYALATAFLEERICLRPGDGPKPAVKALDDLPGIGPWTANYIAMRALGWSDGWPYGDAVLKKRLGGVDRPDPAWRPWSAYAAVRLWYPPEVLIERGVRP